MQNEPDTLYYDGACPLCSAEIARLKKLKDPGLKLTDVHTLTHLSAAQKQDMLTTLRLERADGAILRGLDANVAAWQHTRFGFVFRWLRWPVIAPVADAVYRLWAKRRYGRMYENQSDTGHRA